MSLKSLLRGRSVSCVAVCLSCVALLCFLNVLIPLKNTEEFSLCNDGITYLLGQYKELAFQRKTLQKQRYLEVKELKTALKKTTVDLKKKEEECSSDIRRLNTSVYMWQKKSNELQHLLDGAFGTMDGSSVVLTAVLQALQEAELRVEQLERQLAGSNSSSRIPAV